METTRRPIKARNTRWAAATAAFLARRGIRPNQISVASAVFAAGAGACLALTTPAAADIEPWLFLAAALLIQLRLLCNLFDGMVALEGGFQTRSGEIFNELPDRFADAFVLIGAGYAAAQPSWSPTVGWLCAVLAVLTAYVRALGASAGASQQFCGPMAKPHRMAILTATCAGSAFLFWTGHPSPLLSWSLLLIAAGCLVTILRRTRRIVRQLESA